MAKGNAGRASGAESFLTRAHQALEDMRASEALALYQQAADVLEDPDTCAGGRWTCYMLLGDFERAWRESDAIQARKRSDPHRFWDGEPLVDKRVLIRCLHGLGDTLQFIRYAPMLREQNCSLVIEAQPALTRLLAASDLADAVITWGDPEGKWDSQVEVVELPRIFRPTLDTLPRRVPYLQTTASPEGKADEGRELRVGVVWRSSSFNPARSVEPELIAELFTTTGIKFANLQTSSEMVELERWQATVPMLHREGDDVLATACKLEQLDLVVTVDTMVAHLAGALGKPVWTLLPYQCDWRWMLTRNDSPWYPTMRLYRQPRPGDWRSVLNHIRNDLQNLSLKHLQTGWEKDLYRVPAK